MSLCETKYGEIIIDILRRDILKKCKKGYGWGLNEYGEMEVDNCFYNISNDLEYNILKLFKKHCIELKKYINNFSFIKDKDDILVDLTNEVMDIIDEQMSYEDEDDIYSEAFSFYNNVDCQYQLRNM